jgi:GAF domain-containing protein
MHATGYDLEPVLRAVARTTAACLGFGTAVINMYRPAWDDFHTVVVEGNDRARELLLGQSSVAEDWAPLLEDRFERRGAYLIRHGDFDWSHDRLTTYVPEVDLPLDADGWHPEDALFVPLRSSAGEMLGILSVDEPADGRRPSDEQLDLLVGMSQHAAIAIEHAQQAAAAERQRVAVDHLLGLTASLAERRTIDEMLDAVCVGIRDALGFQRVCVSLEDDEPGILHMRAHVGMSPEELERLETTPMAAVAPLLDPALERDGVVLRECSGTQFDPRVVGAFLRVLHPGSRMRRGLYTPAV